MGKVDQENLGYPWPNILTQEERSERLAKIYYKLKSQGITANDKTAADIGVHPGTITKYSYNPPLPFVLKYCYLYEIDPLEIYPELIWLRNLWLGDFENHIRLLKQAVALDNSALLIELIEACEYGLSLYLNPEVVNRMTTNITGESKEAIAIANKGKARRKRHESTLQARHRQNEKK